MKNAFSFFVNCVLRFNIFYILEPILNKTISGEMTQDSRGKATITELKSHTTYMVTIASITNHGEGLHSDPLINTTLEEGKFVFMINWFLLNLYSIRIMLFIFIN